MRKLHRAEVCRRRGLDNSRYNEKTVLLRRSVFLKRKLSFSKQSGSIPVLEEPRTMLYVTNRNMITMAISIF